MIDFTGNNFLALKPRRSQERIHEKRLPEAPRTRNEQHLALIMHNDFDKARLVDVIAMIAD